MKFVAASVVALCSLAIGPVQAASATDGTIYFNGEIVLSTMAPEESTAPIFHSMPQHSMVRKSLALEAEFDLLDYYAEYMVERGVARTRLTLQTSAYD